MPKSRNRKGHAKKVQSRKNEIVRRRKEVASLIKQLETEMNAINMPAPTPQNYNISYEI